MGDIEKEKESNMFRLCRLWLISSNECVNKVREGGKLALCVRVPFANNSDQLENHYERDG